MTNSSKNEKEDSLSKNMPTDLQRLIEDANSGNATAQYRLGLCYEEGDGVEQDYEMAVFWYKKAAEQGNVDARYSLGNCYLLGCGVEKDTDKGFNLMKKAMDEISKRNMDKLIRDCLGHDDDEDDWDEDEEDEEGDEDDWDEDEEDEEGDEDDWDEEEEDEEEEEDDDDEDWDEEEYGDATHEEMKAEAIKRMKYLRLFDEVIDDFIEDRLCVSEPPVGVYSTVNGENRERIHDLEKRYGLVVYLVVRCNTNYGVMDNYLYVSHHKSDWMNERYALRDNSAYAYVYNRDRPDVSEFGLIGIQRTYAAGLVRTR